MIRAGCSFKGVPGTGRPAAHKIASPMSPPSPSPMMSAPSMVPPMPPSLPADPSAVPKGRMKIED